MNETSRVETSRWARGWAAIGACLLVAMFFGLTQTAQGLEIGFFPPYTRSTPGEVYFWLGHALLLVPAFALLGYALAPRVSDPLARLWSELEGLSPRTRRQLILALTLLGVAAFRLGRWFFLRDMPVTDDELGAQFGGRVLALGHLMVPAFEPLKVFPVRFLFLRDGLITSFDFPGIQVAWAISELTHLGPWLFAIAAAATLPALFRYGVRRGSAAWGTVLVGMAFFSPMFFTLSLTSHAQMLSRTFLVWAILYATEGEQSQRMRSWVLAGLFAGLGVFCRPFEILLLMFPWLVSLVWRSFGAERTTARRALVGVVLGLAVPIAVFAAWNQALTGHWWLQARFAPNPLQHLPHWRGPSATFHDLGVLWNRFGANTSYNVFMLTIWLLGPLGVLLVLLGWRFDRITRLLLAGVLCHLALGLLHDDHGLHLVGPIHYSEDAIPLLMIAMHGLQRLRELAARHAIAPRRMATVLCSVTVLGLGVFISWHALALREESEIHQAIYDFIDGSVSHAVVMAPSYGKTWQQIPGFADVGSFVFDWRHPWPNLDDESVIILSDFPEYLPALRRRFPDRSFFRLRVTRDVPYLALEPVK